MYATGQAFGTSLYGVVDDIINEDFLEDIANIYLQVLITTPDYLIPYDTGALTYSTKDVDYELKEGSGEFYLASYTDYAEEQYYGNGRGKGYWFEEAHDLVQSEVIAFVIKYLDKKMNEV